jgi:hypothetical protein
MPTPADREDGVLDCGGDFLSRWMHRRAPLARQRFEARERRLACARRERSERRRRRRAAMPGRDADRATKRAVIEAAVERARQRRRSIRE